MFKTLEKPIVIIKKLTWKANNITKNTFEHDHHAPKLELIQKIDQQADQK